LHAPDDFFELIVAEFGIRLTEIRPGMNIIEHQLEIVAMDVVVEAASNRRDAVITLLPVLEFETQIRLEYLILIHRIDTNVVPNSAGAD
jgi:phospholipid N-methyltransferase